MSTGDLRHRNPHLPPAAFLLWLVFFLNDSIHSQTPVIRDVRIQGNRAVSEKKILDLIRSRPGAPYDASVWQNDLRAILEYYSTRGLIFTSIDSTQLQYASGGSTLTLSIFLSESAVPMVDSVSFSGNHHWSDSELQAGMDVRNGKIFQSAELEGDIDVLLDRYETAGFPFASIVVDQLTTAGDRQNPRVTVGLEVVEGPRVRLDRWQVAGNRLTRPEVVSREMRLRLPAWYDGLQIKKDLRRLGRMPFLSDAREGDLVQQNDTAWTMQIVITESPANSIDGILGYVPAQSGERGYFAGFANMKFLNLAGTGRAVEARWQKKDRSSAYFFLAYTEPWIAGFPMDITVSADWLVQDTTYTDQGWNLTAEYQIDAAWTLSTGLGRRTVTPVDRIIAYTSGVADAGQWNWQVGATVDTRDHLDNPSRGLYYRAGVVYHRKTERSFVADANGPDSLALPTGTIAGRNDRSVHSTQRLSTEIQAIVPLTRRLVIFNALHAEWFRSPDALPNRSELIRFGGLRTLRGYPEDFFEASRAVWNNFELRWLTSRKSRIFAFVDAGHYLKKLEDSGRIRNQTGFPLGYGMGLRFETRAGMMALDFGLGRGDAFSQTKVHVGLATQF